MVEQTSIEESFDRVGPDLDEEEAHKVKVLIRWILQYDPANRPSLRKYYLIHGSARLTLRTTRPRYLNPVSCAQKV